MHTRLGRALLAFLALPGTVAFLVPLTLLRDRRQPFTAVPAIVPLGLGIGLLAWCVREFHVAGQGTLAPWSPPRHLVVSGPYRVSRNPMYVAVILILCGWAIGFRSIPLATYAAAIAVAFHLRVTRGEEPWLARRHGVTWETYRTRVPRWVRLRHRSEPPPSQEGRNP